MSLINPLPTVWDAFEVADQAIRFAKKMTDSPQPFPNSHCREELATYQENLLDNAKLSDIAAQRFNASMAESNDLFVLALWAAFERFLRTYLQGKGRVLQTQVTPDLLGNALYEHFYKEVEYWKANELLDLLKSPLPNKTDVIGQAKQVVKYRDWVAHGKNQAKRLPSNIVPSAAYGTLDDIINELIRLDKQP
ncbi:MAG: hypothetical protein GY862_02840 [Gammaproteobacteria bacterium]|nr:hypothetical protein [Gammaproteobacteria bacterium]